MVSTTAATKVKTAARQRNMGKKRKKKLARDGSTPSKAAFFGESKKKD